MKVELPQKLLLFRLDDKSFGLDVTAVQEILSRVKARHLPRSVEHIIGVFDFRGQIIPLLNLKALLSLPTVSNTGNVVVISQQGQLMGIMVDKVLAVLTDQDQSKQLATTQLENPYVAGLVTYKGQDIPVLNLASIAMIITLKEETHVSNNA